MVKENLDEWKTADLGVKEDMRERDTQTERVRYERKSERQGNRERDRERQRERGRERQRETEREREGERGERERSERR